MFDYAENEPLSQVFNVRPEDYVDISIESLTFSYRLHKRLSQNNINCVSDLLMVNIDFLKSIHGFGVNCLKQVISYCESLAQTSNSTESERPLSICKLIADNKDAIALGDFSFTDSLNLSEDDNRQLTVIKELYNDLGAKLAFDCINSPKRLVPIIDALSTFIKKFSILDKLEPICVQIPEFRRNNTAKYYIEAFSYDDAIRIKLTQCYSSPKETLGAIIHTINVEDKEQVILAENFLCWCRFDLSQEIAHLFERVYSSPRIQTVIEGRANGLTLNDLGERLGITRERVRQIEAKAIRKFKRQQRQIKIMSKIYADHNGQSIIPLEYLEKVAGDNTTALIYLLKDSGGSVYNYDQQLDVFIFGDNELSSQIQDFIDTLPDILYKKDLDRVLRLASKEYGIEEEYVKKVLDEVYRSTGDIFHRSRLSLAKIYDAILKKHFPNGIHVYDVNELDKLRQCIYNDYGNVSLPVSNHAIAARISSTCVLAGRGIYIPKRNKWISKRLAERLLSFIMHNKNPILLIGNVFSVFEDDLTKEGIDNRYFLQGVLHELFADKLYFRRDYVSRDKGLTSIYSSIVSFIKKSQYPVKKEEIKHYFKGITDVVIALATSDSEILNFFGEYLHADNLVIRESERKYIADYLSTLLSDGEAHHIKEIYHTICSDRPELFSRNAVTFSYRAFSFLEHLFRDQYQFSRPYIALHDAEIGRPNERLQELLYSMDTFPVSIITEFAKENHMQIPVLLEFINSLNDKYFFLDADTLASMDEIGVDGSVASGLETCICAEITGTILIRELKGINNYPKIKVPWNEWLIYSVLNKWSTKLEVSLSSSQLRHSLPLVAKTGELDVSKYKDISTPSTHVRVDNLDDIDELLEDILTDELLEETE